MFGWGASKAEKEAAANEDLKEKLRGWQRELKGQVRVVERQCREINRQSEKMTAEAKMLAKKNQAANVRTLAKHIVKARRTVERLELTKAQLNSISMQLAEQAATIRVTGALAKAGDIMKTMGALMKAPEVMGSMQKLGAEMSKAGIISEMVDDAMESAMPVEEGEVDAIVEHVLYEVTAGAMGVPPPTAPARLQAAAAALHPKRPRRGVTSVTAWASCNRL